MPLVTIRTIAVRLGIHPSTVARALRHDTCISEETRLRVASAATEMGYVPDPVMARLSSYRASTKGAMLAKARLAVLLERPRPYVESGFCAEAQRLGYDTMRLDPELLDRPRHLACAVADLRIAGILAHANRPCPSAKAWQGLAVVWNDQDADAQVPAVFSDRAAAMEQAFHRAQLAGHRRIGAALFTGPIAERGRAPLGAFLACQQCAGNEVDPVPPYCVDGDHTDDRYAAWLARWRPTVLIGHNSYFVWRAQCVGYRFPSDMSYIELTGTEQYPCISGVLPRSDQAGRVAARLLDGMFRRNERIPVHDALQVRIRPGWQAGDCLLPAPPIVDRARADPTRA